MAPGWQSILLQEMGVRQEWWRGDRRETEQRQAHLLGPISPAKRQ